MSLTIVRLTLQRLNAVSDADIDAFTTRVPPSDRCTYGAQFPSRATWLRYATDQTNVVDPDGNVTVEAQGLSASVIVDEANAIYAAAMLRARGTEARLTCWLSPIDGRTVEAITTLLAHLTTRGFTAVESVIANDRVGDWVARHPRVLQLRNRRLRVEL